MGFIINPYMVVAADASVTPPFDDYGSPIIGYSMRKLDSSYSGSAIRVREDSGNAEADIGFDGDGNLDTSALLSHTSSNSGFIVKWYDQSGNSQDLSQATTGSQPKIVNSGSVYEVNGKPAMLFDGSDDFLTNLAGAGFAGNTSEVNHYSVHSLVDVSPLAGGVLISSTTGSYEEYFIMHETSTGAAQVNAGSPVYYKNGSVLADSNQNTVQAAFVTGSQSLASITDLNMRWFGSGSDFIIGSSYVEVNFYGQEFLFWRATNLPTQADVETNINSYFSIY